MPADDPTIDGVIGVADHRVRRIRLEHGEVVRRFEDHDREAGLGKRPQDVGVRLWVDLCSRIERQSGCTDRRLGCQPDHRPRHIHRDAVSVIERVDGDWLGRQRPEVRERTDRRGTAEQQPGARDPGSTTRSTGCRPHPNRPRDESDCQPECQHEGDQVGGARPPDADPGRDERPRNDESDCCPHAERPPPRSPMCPCRCHGPESCAETYEQQFDGELSSHTVR